MKELYEGLDKVMKGVPARLKSKPKVAPQQMVAEDPLIAKMRKWVLVGLTGLVAGAALILIIIKIITKIF